ncbi:hypothetical protein FHX42_001633 [Saccharopolyspora lacisalsi]|uniref:Uncharacterized protein n=1 Tax=Halosaccharopolyspora lacisalsi TaxID=1000566 RepID=A0A839DVL9_9PSEU|nr:hypothetical protein [Halosaccharopolyspora lacisalsi]
MAVYPPILTALLAGVSFLGGLTAVGISPIVITLVLVIALRFGKHVSTLVRSPDPEVFLLRALALMLAVTTTVTKVATGWFTARMQGATGWGAPEPGPAPVARGLHRHRGPGRPWDPVPSPVSSPLSPRPTGCSWPSSDR